MAPVTDFSQYSLESLVNSFRPGGTYGIEWQLQGDRLKCRSHYNPQWRLDAVKAKGLDGLYTERSTGYEFMVGQGYVGKAFAKQEVLFVEDVQHVDEDSVRDCMQLGDATEYLRSNLAKDFDIHSVIFLPVPNGVLEVGSTAVLPSIPADFASLGQSTPAPGPPAKGAEETGAEDTVPSPPPFLKKLVDTLCSAACYGIQWVHDGEVLKFGGHYNPEWRIEGVRRQGLKGLYTLRSRPWTFPSGEGLVGKAYAEQAVLFVEDMQMVTPDEVQGSIQTGSNAVFLRSALAREFGIHSALFLPSSEGVIEIGSIQIVETLQNFLSEQATAAIAGKEEAAEILCALRALAA